MKLLSNPRIEHASEKIQALIEKQKVSGIQRNLDQFRLMLEQNPAIQKNLAPKRNLIQMKQARIDTYWK